MDVLEYAAPSVESSVNLLSLFNGSEGDLVGPTWNSVQPGNLQVLEIANFWSCSHFFIDRVVSMWSSFVRPKAVSTAVILFSK